MNTVDTSKYIFVNVKQEMTVTNVTQDHIYICKYLFLFKLTEEQKPY